MEGEIEACATGCTTYHGDVLHYRAAEVGHLCRSCLARIRYRLDEAPVIVRTLRAGLVPLRAVDTTSVRVSGTREAPLPLDDGSLEAADDMFAGLANWALSHAQAMGAVGGLPTWLQGLADVEKDARHLPAGSSARIAEERTRDVVGWLQTWGDAIAWTIAPSSLASYHDDVVDMVRRNRGRAGLSEPRRVSRMRLCPVCGEQEGEASAPDVGPVVFRCRACHTVLGAAELEMTAAA